MKVATPDELVVPVTVVINDAPLPAVSVTVSPISGLLLASLAVTVIVEELVPLAYCDVGLATTVEFVADAGPATKATVGVCVTITEVPVVSVAVYVTVWAVVSATVNVAIPLVFVMPDTVVISDKPDP